MGESVYDEFHVLDASPSRWGEYINKGLVEARVTLYGARFDIVGGDLGEKETCVG